MARVKFEIPQRFPFSTEIPIRISDINYGGHLGNDAVLTIVHEARIQFLQNFGYTEFNIEGLGIMMTDAVIVYTAEGFHRDVLSVEVGVSDFQATTCDFIFRLTNKTRGKEIARVKTGIVFMDPTTRKIAPLPEAFRKKCDSSS